MIAFLEKVDREAASGITRIHVARDYIVPTNLTVHTVMHVAAGLIKLTRSYEYDRIIVFRAGRVMTVDLHA